MKKWLNIYRRYFWSCEKYARFLGVKIGENCAIATRNFGAEPYLITIGDHVQITKDVKFFCHGSAWVFRDNNPKLDFFGKIEIGDNVYIGNNVLILPGVTIGNNVIIGAGSVVTRSIPSESVAAGNPARVISTVLETEKKVTSFDVNTKGMSYQDKRKYLLSLTDDKFIKK